LQDLLRSTLFYAAALAIVLGICALVHPLPTFAYRTRLRALIVIIVSGAGIAIFSTTTPRETTVASPSTVLDQFAPTYQFREVHETRIAAPAERVYAAIKTVTPDEIALYQTFTWIRRFGRPAPQGVLNAPGRRSILDTALRGGFLMLAEEANREIVFGTLAIRPAGLTLPDRPTPEGYRLLDKAGIAKATMNFLIDPIGADQSRLVTETRVYATNESALQAFTPYWLAIYPGSAILRVTWLRAIKARAEGPNAF
jgi:hypothetical protein